VILQKPDLNYNTLYNQAGAVGYHWALNNQDITANCDQAGTYWLRLTGIVEYATAWFKDVSLSVDDSLPEQAQITNVQATSTTSVRVDWAICQGATSYKLYYRKPGDSWSSVSGITDLYYEKTGLDVCQDYEWKVAGVNGSGEGATSSTYTQRTNCAYTKEFAAALGLAETFERPVVYERALADSLGLVEAFTIYRAKEFVETLGILETFTKRKSALLVKVCSEPLGLIEHFIAAKISPLVADEERILACLSAKTVQNFLEGTGTGTYDTDDLDFGAPGVDKTLDEIWFGCDKETPTTISVYVSTDGGVTWTYLGQDITQTGILGNISCWVTAEKFRIRFQAPGLSLNYINATAIPRGEVESGN